MDLAAECGNFELVKWLHYNRDEGCTDALEYAAINGHLEIAEFLAVNRYLGCNEESLEGAVANGHLEVVQWLLNCFEFDILKGSVVAAFESNRFDILKLLIEHKEMQYLEQKGCSSD